MKILVTGATGKLGGKVMESLLHKVSAKSLAVSVRDPKKADHLKALGVDVRQGDFDKPEALKDTFAGIDKILIISTDGDNATRIRQHKNAVNAAKEAGVKFIAYTSIANADNSTLSLAEVHRATEAQIKDTGIPYAMLRNNWYLENETMSIKASLGGAPWMTAAGDGKVGWALQKDYAEAAASILSGDGHENKVYELSGSPLSQQELVSALEEVAGVKINVIKWAMRSIKKRCRLSVCPDFVVELLCGIQKGIREDNLNVESDDFEKLIGRPPTPIKEALKELLEAIQ